MINKIEKLLDLCIEIAERKLNEPTNRLPPPFGPVDGVIAPAAAAVPAEEPKKTRKPRAVKTEAPADPIEGQLSGIDATKEMTEEESKSKMEEVTKQFVSLCKNDTPEDGKTRAIKLMREVFKVQKLGELTHPQRIKWIAEMEKGILEHK